MEAQSILSLPVLPSTSHLDNSSQVVEVGFKGTRRGYFTTDDDTLRVGDWLVVDAERGEDLGRVMTIGGIAAKRCVSCTTGVEGEAEPNIVRTVIRRAGPEEISQLHTLRADEERVRRKARELVEEHQLRMKVTEAEWQWDRNKLTLFFTAERRVDFRQLVRDLARTFRTRIDLRQIGVRDEASLLGGVGRCGRELCCSTWLREIKPISLQLAKDQNLSLNPAQISGTCGRLMCCLTYEHDSYLAARKRFPREGKVIRTTQGAEKVIAIDIWHDQVTLLDEAKQRRILKLDALRAEMTATQASDPSGLPGGGKAAAEGGRRRDPRRPVRGQPALDLKTSDS
ncbi:MAG: Signal peptidase-like protein [Gemmatimonadota bacterium]|nr:Signal peptidase-like protein [Gemmatimonadota bacterium]